MIARRCVWMIRSLLAASVLSLPVQAALAQSDPAKPVSPVPQRDVGPDKAREFKTAGDLLEALETADKGLRTFSAGIRYTKVFAEIEGGDTQAWQGKLYFDVKPDGQAVGPDAPTRKRFAVIFDTLIVGERKREESKHLIFDGEYLVERNTRDKQFLKRRVVPKGERTDPLRLGEGPFPLPIGQRKAEILKRLDVELRPYEDGLEGLSPAARERYKDTVQLRLVPKFQTRDGRDLQEIRIWYRRSDLLPRLARTKSVEGSTSEVLLINQTVNEEIPASVFSVEPPTEPDWSVDIREQFRGPTEDGEPPVTPAPVPPATTPGNAPATMPPATPAPAQPPKP